MINIQEIEKYWDDRTKEQGARTVGYCGQSLDKQDVHYGIRKKFIFNHCPTNLKTLDFGCGTGRYSDEFNNCLGVDITESLLNIAIKNNPEKDYQLIKVPSFTVKKQKSFKLVFTATVLQHNDDDTVSKIIKSWKKITAKDCKFCFYENDHGIINKHAKSRTPEEYIEIVKEHFKVNNWESDSHIIHGEKHSLTLIEVTNER